MVRGKDPDGKLMQPHLVSWSLSTQETGEMQYHLAKDEQIGIRRTCMRGVAKTSKTPIEGNGRVDTNYCQAALRNQR